MTAMTMRNRLHAVLAVCGVVLMGGCAQAKPTTESFAWKGPVAKGSWLRLRNISGDFEIRATDGDSAEITLQIERSNAYAPETQVKVLKAGDDVIACVLYGSDSECSAGSYKGGNTESFGWISFLRGNTSVHGTIRVPRGVRLDVESTNGDMDIDEIDGDLLVRTVNGDVDVRGVRHSATIETTNGDVDLGADAIAANVQVTTTNGDVGLAVPRGVNASLAMQTVNGELTLGMPASITSKTGKSITGQFGTGGATIKLETTNGDISLRERTP